MKDLLLIYFAACYFIVPLAFCASPKWQVIESKPQSIITRIAVQVLLLAWPYMLLRNAIRCDYPRKSSHG